MPATTRSQISLRVPADILADMDRIATALERDRSWVMLRAFRTFLDSEGADILEEMQGIAELDNGQSHDLDDVLAEAEAMVAARTGKSTRKAG